MYPTITHLEEGEGGERREDERERRAGGERWEEGEKERREEFSVICVQSSRVCHGMRRQKRRRGKEGEMDEEGGEERDECAVIFNILVPGNGGVHSCS